MIVVSAITPFNFCESQDFIKTAHKIKSVKVILLLMNLSPSLEELVKAQCNGVETRSLELPWSHSFGQVGYGGFLAGLKDIGEDNGILFLEPSEVKVQRDFNKEELKNVILCTNSKHLMIPYLFEDQQTLYSIAHASKLLKLMPNRHSLEKLISRPLDAVCGRKKTFIRLRTVYENMCIKVYTLTDNPKRYNLLVNYALNELKLKFHPFRVETYNIGGEYSPCREENGITRYYGQVCLFTRPSIVIQPPPPPVVEQPPITRADIDRRPEINFEFSNINRRLIMDSCYLPYRYYSPIFASALYTTS